MSRPSKIAFLAVGLFAIAGLLYLTSARSFFSFASSRPKKPDQDELDRQVSPESRPISEEDRSSMTHFAAENVSIREDRSDPQMTVAVLAQLPGFRNSLEKLTSENDVFIALSQPPVQRSIAKQLADLLGDTRAENDLCTKISEKFAQARSQLNPDVCAISQIYIFNLGRLKAKMRLGERFPFFQYDTNNDKIILRENNFADDANTPVIFMASGPSAQYGELIASQFNEKWMPFFKSKDEHANVDAAYELFDSVVGPAIIRLAPKYPEWFLAGLRNYIDTTCLSSITGEPRAQGGLSRHLKAPLRSAERNHVPVLIRRQGASIDEAQQTISTTLLFFKIRDKYGSNAWIARLSTMLDNRVSPPSDDAFRALVREACGFDALNL